MISFLLWSSHIGCAVSNHVLVVIDATMINTFLFWWWWNREKFLKFKILILKMFFKTYHIYLTSASTSVHWQNGVDFKHWLQITNHLRSTVVPLTYEQINPNSTKSSSTQSSVQVAPITKKTIELNFSNFNLLILLNAHIKCGWKIVHNCDANVFLCLTNYPFNSCQIVVSSFGVELLRRTLKIRLLEWS